MDQKDEVTFEVNGVKLKTSFLKLVARDILEIAREGGAIPGKPDDYILQGKDKEYKLDDWVDLEEDNDFVTIRNAPTPVA